MADKFKLICNTCNSDADVMGYRKLDVNTLLITYICPVCGESQEIITFMYEKN